MDIKTFVFMDSETTGLPFHQNNKTKITELCLTAVQSNHIRLGVFPRIQNKVSLCFNPRKFIDPEATRASGLSNELLEYQPEFGKEAFGILQDFLSLHRKPICFVAHNGYGFDYPILRAEIHKSGNILQDDILCVDSLKAFRELYAEDARAIKENVTNESVVEKTEQEIPPEFQDGFDELLCSIAEDVESSSSYSGKKPTVEEIQKINETTPQKTVANSTYVSRSKESVNNTVVIKRQLYFGQPSFKLGEVYKRLTSKEPTDAHKAEYDVNMLIECAATLGDRFVDWSNLNAKKFCDIPMMQPGKSVRC